MSKRVKCAGGYELPGMGKPCKKCGATDREPCPEFARQQAYEIASLRAQLAETNSKLAALNLCESGFLDRKLRELDQAKAQLASARKALEPFATFGGNNVDEHGWKSNIHREQISTWFGPSEFRAAASTYTDEHDK